MQLDSGELDTRITVERRSQKRNSIGEVKGDWDEVGSYWAKLTTANQRTLDLAKGFSASVSHDCKLRYRSSINNDCRVKAKGKEFQVSGVIHDIAKEWSQLFLVEVVD